MRRTQKLLLQSAPKGKLSSKNGARRWRWASGTPSFGDDLRTLLEHRANIPFDDGLLNPAEKKILIEDPKAKGKKRLKEQKVSKGHHNLAKEMKVVGGQRNFDSAAVAKRLRSLVREGIRGRHLEPEDVSTHQARPVWTIVNNYTRRLLLNHRTGSGKTRTIFMILDGLALDALEKREAELSKLDAEIEKIKQKITAYNQHRGRRVRGADDETRAQERRAALQSLAQTRDKKSKAEFPDRVVVFYRAEHELNFSTQFLREPTAMREQLFRAHLQNKRDSLIEMIDNKFCRKPKDKDPQMMDECKRGCDNDPSSGRVRLLTEALRAQGVEDPSREARVRYLLDPRNGWIQSQWQLRDGCEPSKKKAAKGASEPGLDVVPQMLRRETMGAHRTYVYRSVRVAMGKEGMQSILPKKVTRAALLELPNRGTTTAVAAADDEAPGKEKKGSRLVAPEVAEEDAKNTSSTTITPKPFDRSDLTVIVDEAHEFFAEVGDKDKEVEKKRQEFVKLMRASVKPRYVVATGTPNPGILDGIRSCEKVCLTDTEIEEMQLAAATADDGAEQEDTSSSTKAQGTGAGIGKARTSKSAAGTGTSRPAETPGGVPIGNNEECSDDRKRFRHCQCQSRLGGRDEPQWISLEGFTSKFVDGGEEHTARTVAWDEEVTAGNQLDVNAWKKLDETDADAANGAAAFPELQFVSREGRKFVRHLLRDQPANRTPNMAYRAETIGGPTQKRYKYTQVDIELSLDAATRYFARELEKATAGGKNGTALQREAESSALARFLSVGVNKLRGTSRTSKHQKNDSEVGGGAAGARSSAGQQVVVPGGEEEKEGTSDDDRKLDLHLKNHTLAPKVTALQLHVLSRVQAEREIAVSDYGALRGRVPGMSAHSLRAWLVSRAERRLKFLVLLNTRWLTVKALELAAGLLRKVLDTTKLPVFTLAGKLDLPDRKYLSAGEFARVKQLTDAAKRSSDEDKAAEKTREAQKMQAGFLEPKGILTSADAFNRKTKGILIGKTAEVGTGTDFKGLREIHLLDVPRGAQAVQYWGRGPRAGAHEELVWRQEDKPMVDYSLLSPAQKHDFVEKASTASAPEEINKGSSQAAPLDNEEEGSSAPTTSSSARATGVDSEDSTSSSPEEDLDDDHQKATTFAARRTKSPKLPLQLQTEKTVRNFLYVSRLPSHLANNKLRQFFMRADLKTVKADTLTGADESGRGQTSAWTKGLQADKNARDAAELWETAKELPLASFGDSDPVELLEQGLASLSGGREQEKDTHTAQMAIMQDLLTEVETQYKADVARTEENKLMEGWNAGRGERQAVRVARRNVERAKKEAKDAKKAEKDAKKAEKDAKKAERDAKKAKGKAQAKGKNKAKGNAEAKSAAIADESETPAPAAPADAEELAAAQERAQAAADAAEDEADEEKQRLRFFATKQSRNAITKKQDDIVASLRAKVQMLS
eukprot:g13388.t1